MKSCVVRFNIYLLAGPLLLCGGGCASRNPRNVGELAAIRLHLEVNPDGTDNNSPVLIGHSAPFLVNLNKEPFLTEYQVTSASLVDSYGGFSLSIRFDTQGSWVLEQYTVSGKGKRVGVSAIFGEAQDPRWLGAPRITQRITNGVFVFTPDLSRNEADRLVAGLNNFASESKKGRP